MKYNRKTNLRVRAYATSKGVTLGQMAGYLGISPTRFSQTYMSRELLKEDQDFLIRTVDEMCEVGYGQA